MIEKRMKAKNLSGQEGRLAPTPVSLAKRRLTKVCNQMKPPIRFMLQVAVAMAGAFAIMPQITARTTRAPIAIRVAPANCFGQTPSRPSGESDRHRVESERDLELRIWNLRALSEQPRRPEKKRPNPQQELAEMQKDFTRLQIINKELLRVALGNGTLDPRFVLKSVSEIKERAERLNKNLVLPDLDSSAGQSRTNLPAGPDRLKRSVIRLGTLIFSFVDNPFFKEISVVDTQQTMKARRDLEDIIELSGEIKKNNEVKN